jgi:hypothetical protein
LELQKILTVGSILTPDMVAGYLEQTKKLMKAMKN